MCVSSNPKYASKQGCPPGFVEQGMLNLAITAVEDWMPNTVPELPLTASLDPTLFAQNLWTPAVPYMRRREHTPASTIPLLDYLLSPPHRCEKKARRVVTLHMNANGKTKAASLRIFLSTSTPGGQLSINCSALRANVRELHRMNYCGSFNKDKGCLGGSAMTTNRKYTNRSTLTTQQKKLDPKLTWTPYWLWDATDGAVYDSTLSLINGRPAVPRARRLGLQPSGGMPLYGHGLRLWRQNSRKCWQRCLDGNDGDSCGWCHLSGIEPAAESVPVRDPLEHK